jgi:SARP family transcriptional regulator, regulator of embCAB operon
MTIADIGILGPLRVRFDDVDAQLSGTKRRSILAVLAVRADTEVRRDELIDELNLFRSTGDAINALHAHIAKLRRWLQVNGGDSDLLETVNSSYRLNVDRVNVDAHRFVDEVVRALNLAPAVPSIVAVMLEESLSLWRGDALLDAVDGPMAAAAAAELHRMRDAARETLLGAWMSLGYYQKVVLHGRKFIVEDPLNEPIRTHHIIALRRMGRYAEAVEAYRSSECVLSEELGVAPGRELRASVAEMDIAHRHPSAGLDPFGAKQE